MLAEKNVVEILQAMQRANSRAGFFVGSLIGPIVTLALLTWGVSYTRHWSIIISWIWIVCVAVATIHTLREVLAARCVASDPKFDPSVRADAKLLLIAKIIELVVFLCALGAAIWMVKAS